MIMPGILVCFTFLIIVCIFIVSKALLISSIYGKGILTILLGERHPIPSCYGTVNIHSCKTLIYIYELVLEDLKGGYLISWNKFHGQHTIYFNYVIIFLNKNVLM